MSANVSRWRSPFRWSDTLFARVKRDGLLDITIVSFGCAHDAAAPVASDLDGTLLDPEGEVSVRTCRALDRATALDIDIVLVTGRPPAGCATYPLQPALIRLWSVRTVRCSTTLTNTS